MDNQERKKIRKELDKDLAKLQELKEQLRALKAKYE